MSSYTPPRSPGRRFDRRTVKTLVMYVVMYGTALLFLIPYATMISMAFKPENQVFTLEPNWIPDPPTLHWIELVITGTPIVQWTINTAIIATVTTIIVIVVDSMVAFSLTKLEWRGKKVVLSVILAALMVPVYVNIVPLYDLITKLGLTNTLAGMYLPLTAGPLGVFLFVQFFRDMPDSIFEAARMDGFSSLQIYTRIVLPLMKPAISALGLYTFVWSWNQFLWPLVVASGSAKYTLPVGIVTMSPTNIYQPSIAMVGSLIAALPLFIVLMGLQDKMIGAIQMQAD